MITDYLKALTAGLLVLLTLALGVQTYRVHSLDTDLTEAKTKITLLKDDIKAKDSSHALIVKQLEAKAQEQEKADAFLKEQARAIAASRKDGDGALSTGSRDALKRLRDYTQR